MKFLLQVLVFALISTILSCSHTPPHSQEIKLSQAQNEQLNRDALAIASKRLEQMVIQAKSNPQVSTYLATDLFLKANMSLLEGDYTTASVLFKYVSDLVPEDDFVQKKYAVSLIRMGDLEASEVVLEKLYKSKQDEKVGLILAGVYTSTEKDEKARSLYQTLLKKNPKNEDACIFLSKSYAIEKNTMKAIEQLHTCSKNDPKNGMYDYYLGKIYIDEGKLPKAMEAFKKAHARQPSLTGAVSALGAIYEDKEQEQLAIDLYTKHLKSHPQDSVILNRIVEILFRREEFDKVIPYAEALCDLEPDNLNLKVRLGVLYHDVKRHHEAVSVFKDLLKAVPDSDKIIYYLGAIYQDMSEFETSLEYYGKITEKSDLYSETSIQMANILSFLAQAEHFGESETKKWRSVFLSHVNSKFSELKDLKVEFSVIKSGFYESIGEYKNAMESMVVVQDEKGFSTQHKYYLANLFEKENKFDESTNVIMGILEKEPRNAHAWNFLGYALVVRGEKLDQAFEYIQKALALSPDDGYIRDTLGWYYYKKGDVKRALAELNIAFKKVPDDVEILKHLAVIHRDLKDYSKAKTYLESALKHARYQADKEEIKATMEAIESARSPASKP